MTNNPVYDPTSNGSITRMRRSHTLTKYRNDSIPQSIRVEYRKVEGLKGILERKQRSIESKAIQDTVPDWSVTPKGIGRYIKPSISSPVVREKPAQCSMEELKSRLTQVFVVQEVALGTMCNWVPKIDAGREQYWVPPSDFVEPWPRKK